MAVDRNPFTPPPRNMSYDEWLRYLVQSARPDAPGIDYLVDIWAYNFTYGGITPDHQKFVDPFIADATEWLKQGAWGCLNPAKITGNVIDLAAHRNKRQNNTHPKPL